MKSNPNRTGRRQPAARLEFARPTSRHGRTSHESAKGCAPSNIKDLIPLLNAAGRTGSKRRGCRMSRRTLVLADLKLLQIEDAFLDTLLDAHPRRTTALDRLLDDVAAAPEQADAVAKAAVPQPDDAVAAASARRIESSLLAAVIEHHPRRDRALDRLLNDLVVVETSAATHTSAAPDAAHGAWVVSDDDEESRRAEFDAGCDFDFDGLA